MKYPEVKTIYVGVDPSLKGTGVVAINEEGHILDRMTISTPKEADFSERCDMIAFELRDFIGKLPLKPMHCMIEAPSYGSIGPVITLARLNGYVAGTLTALGVFTTIRFLPPKSLKKYFTGNGSATKQLMAAFAESRFGFDCKDNNQVDAFALAMALEAYESGRLTTASRELRKAIK